MSKIRDFTTSYNQKNILGAVSQSGGIPTGAIIERGSNANGEYTKFANGLMLCTLTTSFGNNVNTAIGGVYKSGGYKWTYPVAFAAGTIPSANGKSRNWVSTWLGYETTIIDDNTGAGFCLYSATPIVNSGSPLTVTLSAMGFWF